MMSDPADRIALVGVLLILWILIMFAISATAGTILLIDRLVGSL